MSWGLVGRSLLSKEFCKCVTLSEPVHGFGFVFSEAQTSTFAVRLLHPGIYNLQQTPTDLQRPARKKLIL